MTSTFQLPQPGAAPATVRLMAHTTASQSDIDALAALAERLIVEQTAVFGELPRFDNGTYTFIVDAVPWADDDAMEHRNSTYISLSRAALETEPGRRLALGSIAHEFFHVWNVERVRPQGLEPFDFTRENITCCLWLAEGFTEYYGALTLRRAGLSAQTPLDEVLAVINNPARAVRSAVGMSEHAPFTDAGVSVDRTDESRTFISYYTFGAAIALGLDLTLRDRSNGQLSLDDFLRRLWIEFGAPVAEPGYVARPYSLADLRQVLGTVAGDASFAADFFDRYVEGHETIDYARLLARAGYTLTLAAPGRSTMGRVILAPEGGGLRIGAGRAGARGALVPFDTPAYRAGLDAGDLVVAIDGQPATVERWNALATLPAGSGVRMTIERRDGRHVHTIATLVADPALRLIDNATPTMPLPPDQAAFRASWLGSRGK
jgi:predicted metalloprotease with PDZ domain